ncbi:MAG: hypothetical protein ABI759_13985 [Candidatus Solibacter sp.]
MRYLILLLCAAGWANAQDPGRNRLTISGGWTTQIFTPNYYQQTAPVVGISYAYRPWKILEIETGLSVGLQPGEEQCSAHGCYQPNDRYFWIPLGVRFVTPPLAGRVELSIGGGGLLQRYSISNPQYQYSSSSESGFGGYFVAGAAVALDHRQRFWVSATPRVLLANPEFARYRWFQITGDFSWRF